MPLDKGIREKIDTYCASHLAGKSWYEQRFDFIEDAKLKKQIILEFMSARYIYKVGEALQAKGENLLPFVKFQITQYASIYEAIIVHLLWGRYQNHELVTEMEYHSAFKEAGSFPKGMMLSNVEGEQIYLCVKRKEKTVPHSIKFNDKVDCAVGIGFVDKAIGVDIKEFYRLRNAIHIETAVKKSIAYELSQSELAYKRMQPFVDDIRKAISEEERVAVPIDATLSI